jgi:hypothetical protein
MTPVNHAAAALVIRKFRPNTPLWPLLLATQLFDFIWVLLNFSGVEQTDTNDPVLAINDIHFTYMPLSHSIVSTLIVAGAVWLIFLGLAPLPWESRSWQPSRARWPGTSAWHRHHTVCGSRVDRHGPEAIFADKPLLFFEYVAIAMALSVVLVWWRARSP